MLAITAPVAAVLVGCAAAWAPTTLYGFTTVVLATAVMGAVFWRQTAPGDAISGHTVLVALAFRYCMGLASLVVGLWVYQGMVDFPSYNEISMKVGEKLLTGDFSGFQVFDRISSWWFGYLLGVLYLAVGPGIVGQFFMSALIGFIGGYLYLRAFRLEFPEAAPSYRFLAFALFYLPTLAYWTSLLGKDSWMALFLGLGAYAASRLLKSFTLRHLGLFLVALAGTAMVRPAIAVVVLVALGFAATRVAVRDPGSAAFLRPMIATVILVAVVGAFVQLGSLALVEKHAGGESLTIVAGQMALMGVVDSLYSQHVGLASDPNAYGSSLGVQIAEPTMGAVARFLPFGIFTFLFRPFLFEAHNVMAVFAALDSTFLFGLVLWRRRNLVTAVRCALSRPFLTFCLLNFAALTVILSFDSNLGVIVRHRAIVLPFLLILLAVPRGPADIREPETAHVTAGAGAPDSD